MSTADTSWFTEARFGLFIHWGLYAMGARHEWLQANEAIDPQRYAELYFDRFEPDLFEPEDWAGLAASAGMRYLVVTSKHHEGFCLWDSAQTGFTAPNTPAAQDLLRPLLDAFRDRGLRTGLYYSLLDWHHPDFVIDRHNGPLRQGDLAALNAGRDQRRYAAYMREQVRELLSDYGDIDILWFDFSYPQEDDSGKGRTDWESERLVEVVRELAPRVILNDRLDLPGGGDVVTPEQFQPRMPLTDEAGRPVVWEACQTLSGSWGYHREEASWRSPRELITTLIDTVSKGGNLLLNVGPDARGRIDERARSRLQAIGEWMRLHSRSIHGCGAPPADIGQFADGRLTWDARRRRLYAHVFTWPYKHLHLPVAPEQVAYAQFLHDGSEIPIAGLEEWQARWQQVAGFDPTMTTLTLPQRPPAVEVPVIELFLRDE